MSASLKSFTLGAALIGSALAGLPLAGLAQAAPSGTDSMTVVRDADTGKLRAPTAAEVEALQLKAARTTNLRTGPATTLQKFHASGARGVRLTDEFMSYAVAVRHADGSIHENCLHTQEAADAALRAPATVELPTE
jgi:hypothetical protein